MHRDGTLVMFFSPDLASSADMSYRDLVDTALKAHGVWDLLDHENTRWTGQGYVLRFRDGVNIASVLGSNYNFANGGLGILHARDVGWPNQDFRSFTSSRAPYSLQVTTGGGSVPGRMWISAIPTRASGASWGTRSRC
jgi:hypothetical protein